MTANRIADDVLDRCIGVATDALAARQKPDGHWVFELEADSTIPAEYVLLRHYRAEPVDVHAKSDVTVPALSDPNGHYEAAGTKSSCR